MYQTLCTVLSITQYCTYLLEILFSYISELAKRQSYCCVIKQETPISSLAKRLPFFQDKANEKQTERDIL